MKLIRTKLAIINGLNPCPMADHHAASATAAPQEISDAINFEKETWRMG
jgi:hypothetical protein